MRRPTLAVLLLSLLASVLALPASAAPDTIYEVAHVDSTLADGSTVRIRVEIQRTLGEAQPVLLTYSPYNNLNLDSQDRTANDGIWRTFGPEGYARVVADVIGTRGSTGCWDYGGADEQQTGVDVVNWIAEQHWSNGNVGMIGVSYEGTTASMVAARGDDVPALKAIVPIAAISRWYGYAYQDGVRFFLNSFAPTDEGFDTPLAFDFGFGRTVAVADAADPATLAATGSARTGECEAIDHTAHAYDRTPDYTDFWSERDYIRDADGEVHDYDAAVLLVHGWQDYNVKQVEATNLYEALPVDHPRTPHDEGVPFKLLWMTQSTHADGSGEGYTELLSDFLAHTLKGEDNGIERGLHRDGAVVRTQGRTADGAGTVAFEAAWPPRDARVRGLHLGLGADGGTLAARPQDTGPASWVDTGTTSEPVVEERLFGDDDPGAVAFRSAPLSEDVRVTGSIELDAWVRAERGAGAHLTPVVLDIAPGGSATVAARGLLNLDYRNGLAAADPADDGTWVNATVSLLPQDYTFLEGHRIGLLTMSTNTVWAVPGDRAGIVDIATGPVPDVTPRGSVLRLPVVSDGPGGNGRRPVPPRPGLR
jgi:X-Pro dipeptidyl-peptidase